MDFYILYMKVKIHLDNLYFFKKVNINLNTNNYL